MTAEIIQIRDFQNKRDIDRLYQELTLEQQAIEIMSVALIGDQCVMDPTRYPDPPLADYVASAGYPIEDTAPSEYTTPTDDPA